MAEEHRSSKQINSSPTLSRDSWAVILALALAFAIWIGWIKQVPW
ncbi:MAG TPA: hypothetical protein VIH88_02540 [Candidatus Acidoferrales bacterium]